MHNYGYQVREIIGFTLSLILASLSVSLMLVVDRTILGLYSIDSMNAVSFGGNFVATTSFIVTSIAEIATVFVGQYNGLREYRKTAWAPWQMVYLGLLSFAIFVPLSFCVEYLHLFPDHYAAEGTSYIRILLSFTGFHVITVAIASFFIGRKQSFIVIATFLCGNVLNAVLDFIFIFGVKGLFEPMGASGAAIATILVESVFVLILGGVFLNKDHRVKFNTHDAKFRGDLFRSCIRIGFPLSLGKFLNLLGWFLLMYFYVNTSKDLATLESFAVGLWMAFIFFADGSSRALSALSANLIGSKQLAEIKNLLKVFLIFHLVVCAIYSIPMLCYPRVILSFLSKANGNISHLTSDIVFVLTAVFITILTDGIFYLICGVLTSGGDTKFPVVLETMTLWLIVVLPIAVTYYTGTLTSIRPAYTLIPISGIVNDVVVYLRYRQLKWYRQLVRTDIDILL